MIEHQILWDSGVLLSEQTALRVSIASQERPRTVFIYEWSKDTVASFLLIYSFDII